MGKITGSVTDASDKLRDLQIEAAEAFDAIQDEVAVALGQAPADGADPTVAANAIAMQWGRIWFAGFKGLAVAASLQAQIANDLLMGSGSAPGVGLEGEGSAGQSVGGETGDD